jgi:WD40 repeat protein
LDDKLAESDVLSVVGPSPKLIRENETRHLTVKVVGAKSESTHASFLYDEDVSISDLAVNPARNVLALCGGTTVNDEGTKYRGRIQLRDLENGKLVFQQVSDEMWFSAVALSPDGRKLAVGGGFPHAASLQPTPQRPLGSYSDGAISIWNSSTGELLRVLPRLEGVEGNSHRMVESMVFAPDGKMMVTGEMSGLISWWDVSDGRQIRTAQMERPNRKEGELLADPRVLSLAWLDSGRFLLASVGSYNRGGKWGELRVLDNETGRVRDVVLKKRRTPVDAVAVSNDGATIAAATYDGILRLWRVKK